MTKKHSTKIIAIALAVAMLLAMQAVAAFASDTGEGQSNVTFTAGAPDANGVFTVSFSIANATFNAFQFAVKYDAAVIEPVDQSGASATEFDQFAVKDASWLSTIGCSLNAETGFFGFTGYISPGESHSLITNGEAVLTSATELFSFRFKEIKSGDPAMKIATESGGEPYEHALPQGSGIIGRAGESTGNISFDFSALSGGNVSNTDIATSYGSSSGSGSSGGSSTGSQTADSLLIQSVILKIGSYAAVVDSGVTALYPGERDVVPFIDEASRTMVPLRFISERLGANVSWDGDNRSITITKGDSVITMYIDKTDYTVSGQTKTMDTAPKIVNDRTMVPIRFVSEALGHSVGWNSTEKLVIISPETHTWNDGGSLEAEVCSKANTLLQMYSSFV